MFGVLYRSGAAAYRLRLEIAQAGRARPQRLQMQYRDKEGRASPLARRRTSGNTWTFTPHSPTNDRRVYFPNRSDDRSTHIFSKASLPDSVVRASFLSLVHWTL